MSYYNETTRYIRCDLCNKRIAPYGEKDLIAKNPIDYVEIHVSFPNNKDSKVRHICAECVAKIVTERFQIGKGLAGGIKYGTV